MTGSPTVATAEPELDVATPPVVPPPTPVNRHGHVPALDGIRGVAILLVLGVHTAKLFSNARPAGAGYAAYRNVMSAGWCGVDLFFVLSGFLITGILAASRAKPRYFRNFYARRSVRIFPLYYAFLVGVVVLLPVARHWVGHAANAARVTGWYWVYLQNYPIAAGGNWGAGDMTQVTWSLAIEEQFYLVWPLLVWLLSRRAMMWVCAAVVVASPVLRAILLARGVSPLAIYVLTFTRLDGLATGALLALAVGRAAVSPALRRAAVAAAAVAVAGLAALTVVRHGFQDVDPWTQVVGYSCLNVLFGSVLTLALFPGRRSPLVAALASPPLRFFGRYSYGLYLLHLPILGLVRDGGFRHVERHVNVGRWEWPMLLAFQAAVVGLTVAAALVSWNVLEKRCLALKRFFAD